jgi:hypothetical protein
MQHVLNSDSNTYSEVHIEEVLDGDADAVHRLHASRAHLHGCRSSVSTIDRGTRQHEHEF